MTTNKEQLLKNIRDYCAYQERCISEVEGKLRAMKAGPADIERLIRQLINEGFINEERFARAFASGKFRNNGWGKVKIKYEMLQRGIPEEIIRTGLEEIDEQEYEDGLREILKKKSPEIREKDVFRRKQKLIAFAAQRGFEFELVKRVISETWGQGD